MRICGLQKLAMVDFPGKLAATVFTGGCNLRCPFCHNAPLVTHLEEAEHFSEEEVLDFLRRRQGLLDGVVLSGGEPLLHDGVGAFLRKVRDLGFAVKLDIQRLPSPTPWPLCWKRGSWTMWPWTSKTNRKNTP